MQSPSQSRRILAVVSFALLVLAIAVIGGARWPISDTSEESDESRVEWLAPIWPTTDWTVPVAEWRFGVRHYGRWSLWPHDTAPEMYLKAEARKRGERFGSFHFWSNATTQIVVGGWRWNLPWPLTFYVILLATLLVGLRYWRRRRRRRPA